MVSNEGKITTFGTTGTLGGLVDGTDKLHSGILKTLWNVSNGSRVVSSGTFTQSSNRFTLAGTVVYRSLGTKYTLAGNNYADVTAGHSTYDRYDLIYIDRSADALAIAAGTAAAQSTVADIAPEDVPVAIVKVAAGAAATATHNFQVLLSTFDKDVLSDDEVTYAKIQNVSATDRILGRDSSGAGVIEEITPANLRTMINVADGATAYADANAVAAVEAESTLVLQSGVTVGTDLKLSTSSDNVIIENVTQDKDIIFKVDDGGVSTEVMRIDGDVSRVGIGTDAPDSTLHIRGSSNPTVRIQEDSQTGYLDLSGLQDSQASITAQNDTASEVSILDITAKCNSSSGTGQEVRIFRNARTNADGTFSIKQPGTNTNVMVVSSDSAGSAHTMYLDGSLAVNKTSAASGVTLEVNGDVGGDKFKVESIQYELASDFTTAGDIPGPRTAPSLTLTDTDSIYRITTTVGNPPGSANLDVVFPATTGNEGLVLKLIFPSIAGTPDDLVLKGSGTETIIAPDNSVLAASGGGYTLTTAGVYEAICISGSWIFYKIN